MTANDPTYEGGSGVYPVAGFPDQEPEATIQLVP